MEGELLQQIIGTGRFGGPNGMTLENVEIAMKQIGCISNRKKGSKQDDEDDENLAKFTMNFVDKGAESDDSWN